MAYQSYENLQVWASSVDLSVRIYEIMRECRDYGFKDQICRSAVSIPSNIAEGMEYPQFNLDKVEWERIFEKADE